MAADSYVVALPLESRWSGGRSPIAGSLYLWGSGARLERRVPTPDL